MLVPFLVLAYIGFIAAKKWYMKCRKLIFLLFWWRRGKLYFWWTGK